MDKASTDLIEQFARAHEHDVKRTLRRLYGAKLSGEDISDVLQDTYVAASRAIADEKGPRDLPALRMWFYGAVRHKAIDAIRGVEGRRYTRERAVSYDALTEQGAAPEPPSEPEHDESLERVDAPVRAQDVALLRDAFRRLPKQQRQLLRVTDMDEDSRSLRDAAALLGRSKSEVARQRTRALQQLTALVSRERGPDCARARAMTPATAVGESLAWRDVHFADCLRCQVSYGRRVQVLLPFLPLAMPGRITRFAGNVSSAFGRGDVPAEAAAAGVGTAATGLGGAGLIGGGAAAKLAACATVGVAAVACVTVVPGVAKKADAGRTAQAARPEPRVAAAPASTAPSLAARLPLARAVTRTAAAREPHEARPRREGTRRAVAEFSPESFATPAPAATPQPSAPAPPPRPTAPASTPRSPSGFSEEFTP
jgi:RNA polymerase sigma factor (sigma-70 family)